MTPWDELPCAVVITAATGRVLDVNSELLILAGGSRESRIGASIEDLLPPAGRIFLQTHVWPTLLRDGRIQEIHLQLSCADRTRVPVLLNCRLGAHLGQPAYYWTLFAARDRHRFEAELVEQRNLAEATNRALVESQRFIKAITDAIPGLVAYWDKDLRCRFANKAYEDWFGRRPDELLGVSLRDLLGEHVFGLNAVYIEGALAGQEQQFERQLTKADGSIGHTWAHYIPDVVNGEVQGFFATVSDVTALKSTQLALEEAQRLGQTGSWSWRVDGDRVVWSPQMYAILGCDPKAPAPSFAEQASLYEAQDYARLGEQVGRTLQTGEPYTLELRYRQPSGQGGWLEARGETVRGMSGQITGLRGTVQEITQRREQQLALELAQDRLQAMYETTPAMLHSIDAQGRLLHVSDAWLACLGYRREEVIGRPSADFLTEESRIHSGQEVLPRFFATGRCDDVAYQMVTRTGELVDVLMSAILERDEEGQPVRSLTVVQNVTLRRRAERELAKEHERLRNLIEGTNAGTWEWNVQTGEVIVNSRWAAILGWSVEEIGAVTNQFRAEIAHPDELPLTRKLLREHFKGNSDAYVAEVRLRHRDGHWIWVEDRGRLITRTANGRPEWVFGIQIDITERKRRDEVVLRLSAELAEQHELMRVTLESIGDAVITTDAAGLINWLNPVAERMTGWLSSEALGRPLLQVFQILNEETREPAPDPVAACMAEGRIVGLAHQTILISRDNTEYGIQDSAAPILNAQGEMLGVVLVFHDVSEQRRLSGEMTYRATHDALTGLVNRAEFETRMLRTLRQAQENDSHHALMYIDLDQFKLVNDACGHAIGDQLLQQVSKLLADAVRTRDTLARLGGDEFAIILEHCTMEQANRVAQKICDRMDDFRFVHEDRRFRIGTSIGLVPVDKRWSSTAAIQQAADTSCYAAKEAGRNRVHAWFDSDAAMRARSHEIQWTSRIESALDGDGFELFAQRIECLKGQAQGIHAEVLLRMRNADGTLVQPGSFLPAAERFHLVSRVDRWVLSRSAQWLRNLASPERIESLSVNLSGQSVGDRAFHAWACELLAQLGPAVCSKLSLEITETVAVTNLADAAVFIEQVRAAGVKVSLDDFGAGASSFGYLKALPVDYLKIDGQYIRTLVSDPLNDAAVRCFIDVARLMGLKTVAEFVDKADVLDRLQAIGVDYAQGYLLHQPEPISGLLEARAQAVT
ncbi:bifunctional diguanylate cyclase/phosphodiesterase [Paucibacter aquatile]|uniref:Bifunctional diguanylate cyclase/phosphodiesterase n=1 Tax=Kinneretia aquatilis TaxID=2070761 RepID=A0A2N8KZQ2_9BURK|nr:PAS domain S-box protein [Paucibacter aquatile]PND38921.1 bifunctional diguanylate cyclase/phosphodiesterase [Paucibacter aquatile]